MLDKEVARTFDRRAALFLTSGTILTSVLILRMLHMQVFNYREYTAKSENNSYRIQMNMPERGKILSRGGASISRDMPIYRIYIVPEEAPDVDALVDIVASDSHGIAERVNHMRKCYEAIAKKFGEDYARELMHDNPIKIFE